MLSQIFQFILNVYIAILGMLDNTFITPIFKFLNNNIPGFSSWSQTLATFINDYLFKGIAFVREVFFNVTGYPRALFLVLLGFLVFKFNMMLILYGVKGIFNLWGLFKIGKSATSAK